MHAPAPSCQVSRGAIAKISPNTASASQFCGSRGRRSPRSRMRMRAPVSARVSAMQPPPTPEPMITTS